mgnify:CR=1 FL=1
MFDELQQNQALLEITIIFIVLVGIAIWQQLKLASVIMSGIYFSYLFFNIFDPMDRNLEFNEISHLDNQTKIIIETIDELELKDSIDLKEDEPIIEEIKTVFISEKSSVDSEMIISENLKDNNLAEFENLKTQKILKENIIKVVSFELGRNMIDRQLIDLDSTFYISDKRIYCMTKIQNQNNGKIIFHEWYNNDVLFAKVKMQIGWSYNWNTWSYINVSPNLEGMWKIVVTDTLNIRYDSLSFNIKDISLQ